jgi:hypothetical protein
MPKKSADTVDPKFPYTTEPKALRRLLTEIPKKPKPPKMTFDTLKSWNVSNNSNSRTAIRVLKKLGLLNESGEPTDFYVEFMKPGTGPGVLAERIKNVYRELFQNSLAPHRDTDEALKNLFNIHSGGGEDAMRLQIQTFKALSEYANFDSNSSASDKGTGSGNAASSGAGGGAPSLPPVQIDLHIHLPENKATRDYEAIIQDIARYIYGRDIDKS